MMPCQYNTCMACILVIKECYVSWLVEGINVSKANMVKKILSERDMF